MQPINLVKKQIYKLFAVLLMLSVMIQCGKKESSNTGGDKQSEKKKIDFEILDDQQSYDASDKKVISSVLRLRMKSGLQENCTPYVEVKLDDVQFKPMKLQSPIQIGPATNQYSQRLQSNIRVNIGTFIDPKTNIFSIHFDSHGSTDNIKAKYAEGKQIEVKITAEGFEECTKIFTIGKIETDL